MGASWSAIVSKPEFEPFDSVLDRAVDAGTFTGAVAAVGDAEGEAHRYALVAAGVERLRAK